MKKFKELFDIERKLLEDYEKVADDVLKLETEYSNLSDDDLKGKTEVFKNRLNNGETLEDVKIEALAAAREAGKRTLGLTAFKVQIMGALALIDGNIAEMKTGEGKTLTSALTAYVWALEEKGVHIVTVNDYLAKRDMESNGLIYSALGLTTGLNYRDLTPEEKQDAYNSDITYTTNSELGFDYLRDNMVGDLKNRVCTRNRAYVIIDEVDSILIDEARTPLIISGSEKASHGLYQKVDSLVKSFKEDEDYVVNLKDKTTHLTYQGIEKAEKVFQVENLYDVENSQLTHSINQALKANFNMHKDFDYVVRDGQIVIVDQFTGRTMEGRAYSDGLHQAIEAKEHVETQKETKTMATITYQNFFRLYDKSAGMTGTAKTEEEEFQKTYDMDVVQIPTNEPIARLDRDDMVYVNKNAKYRHMIELIKERHKLGQPILIGTVAIETSEEIAKILQRNNIKHQVLNAKNHEAEAEIIANAGQKGAVTISTNMAGRGTDIKLSDEVRNFGTYNSDVLGTECSYAGLLVVGTERHESRRIDNQLRGRSGRQGDKGESIFFVSFEDDLLKRFAKGVAGKSLVKIVGEDEVITQKSLTKQIKNAQKQVESIHYESRKTVLKYDDVLREQREVAYEERNKILTSEDLIGDARELIKHFIENQVKYYMELDDKEALDAMVDRTLTTNREFNIDFDQDVVEQLVTLANEEIDRKIELSSEESMNAFVKAVMIKVLDQEWINHIDEMQILRESVGLRGYGQIDPLQEYQRDGRAMFEDMIDTVEKEIVRIILKGRIQSESDREAMIAKLKQQHAAAVNEKSKTFVNENKVGPNDPCPCGSGKKYKKCHGA